jgi:hypothetical protein
MKSVLCSLILMVLVVTMVFAQPNPDTLWTRTYGTEQFEKASSLVQTNDGGYALAGNDMDVMILVKTNSVGEMEWTIEYDSVNTYFEYEENPMIHMSDGGYLLSGVINGSNPDEPHMVIYKTDSLGSVEWSYVDQDYLESAAISLLETEGGDIIVAGFAKRHTPGGHHAFAMKMNGLGDTLWTRLYSDSGFFSSFDAVRITQNGNFLFVGNWSWGWDINSIYLVKTNNDGEVLWSQSHGIPGYGVVYDAQVTSDGGCVIVGSAMYRDFHIVKVDSLGFFELSRHWDERYFNFLYSVVETGIGEYVVAGISWEQSANETKDIYLAKLDLDLEPVWTRWYGGDNADEAKTLVKTEDNCYVIGGCTRSFGAGNYDMYMIKTGPDASNIPGEPEHSIPESFALCAPYPNPFNATTTISYYVPMQGTVKVDIYNLLGQKTAELVNGINTAGRHQMIGDAGDLPRGVYFVRMSARTSSGEAGDFRQVRKVVLLK